MAYNFLLVDDSKIVRKVMIKALAMTDIQVAQILEADDGAQGLERLKSGKVDLIFLDVNMPVMNGVEFMEHVSRDPIFKQIPVVVVSTEGSDDRIARLTELGVKAYLRKPVTPESLTGTVAQILSKGESLS